MADAPAPSGTASSWADHFRRAQTLLVPLAFVGLLGVLVVPMPAMLLDILLSANLALASLILVTTIFVDSPLDFSVFPSLLLGTSLFRLVLNIATTRLILSADARSPEVARDAAGEVVATFSSLMTSGSLVVGMVLFLILIIVQFVVITKGATRIGEVAARFTLDGMPGKQMAIDADLNAGLIDEQQAKQRRETISQEADFYGAMDGAAKFVRGDAIAGIIITAVNILGGFAIGVLINDWTLTEALGVYTRLTIGDGLVSQIPAFVISVAAGLIITRTSSRSNLGHELTHQLAGRHTALAVTACFLLLMGLVGLPMLPMLIMAAAVGGSAWHLWRKERIQAAADHQARQAPMEPDQAEPEPVEQALHVDTLELEVGYGLVRMVDQSQGGDLLDRITMIRRQLATELGVVMPSVRIRDNMQLEPSAYHVKLRGNSVADGHIHPGRMLAMDSGLASAAEDSLAGTRTREPAFGLEAVWIEPGQKQRAESLNYTVVDATSVLATHLTEVVKAHAHELLSREETAHLINQLKEQAPKLVAEVLEGEASSLKPGDLQKVLQNLLRERVPIRDLETVVEVLGDWAGRTKDLEVLTEYVRNGLRRTICNQYAVTEPGGDGPGDAPPVSRLYCVSLDPALEDRIAGYIERSGEGTSMTMPPAVANRITAAIIEEMQQLIQQGHHPVVLASPQVRGQVHRLLEPHLPNGAVLGYNEISKGVEVESLGLVQLDNSASRSGSSTSSQAMEGALT